VNVGMAIQTGAANEPVFAASGAKKSLKIRIGL
jgi:hypothetical protein